MGMNRRNVLIGLGAATAGGGALFATGAFTTVEAQRSVSVETAADADAIVGLTDATDGNYVTVSDGVAAIDIGSDSAGVNQSARTHFETLLNIANNGTNDVTRITFEIQGENGEEELLTSIPENGYGGQDGEDFTGDDTTVLTPDDDPVRLGLEIELRADHIDETVNAYDDTNGGIDAEFFDPTLVITVETDN